MLGPFWRAFSVVNIQFKQAREVLRWCSQGQHSAYIPPDRSRII
jgi:hypothetical protein